MTSAETKHSGAIFLNDDLNASSVVHKNIGQEYFITTKDKIELALIEQQRYIKIRRDWITPATVLLSLLATLVAADFKDSFGLPASVWQSLFVCLSVGSLIWLAVTGYKALKYRGKGNNKDFIEKLANKIKEE